MAWSFRRCISFFPCSSGSSIGWFAFTAITYHVVMQRVPGWKHPISPAKAVGFHFIPVYFLYWVFKWPQEIAKFVNYKFQRPLMKPQMVGLTLCAAFVIRFFDPGLGLILLFVPTSYLAACLRRALALPPPGTGNAPTPS